MRLDRSRLAAVVDDLARRFAERFPAETPGWRRVGREAEFPVVDGEGKAFDVSALLPLLARSGELVSVHEPGGFRVGVEGGGIVYSLEVGRGTIEIVTGPCDDLVELAAVHLGALDRLVEVATEAGARVLGCGCQPVTEPTIAELTPKRRYPVLLEALGPSWLSFTISASDQTHVDIGRDEVTRATNLACLLSPVTIALCSNSAIEGGRDAGFCCAREARMVACGAPHDRHGMPVGPFEDLPDRVGRFLDYPHLVTRDAGGLYECQTGVFGDRLLGADGLGPEAAMDAYLLHEHYVWHSARPRAGTATVELRASCQQRGPDSMAPAALATAFIEAADDLWSQVHECLGPSAWERLRRWRDRVICDGLAASEPVDGFLAGVLGTSRRALAARGRGEERFLDPLFERLERRVGPAQEIRGIYRQRGLGAVLDRLRLDRR